MKLTSGVMYLIAGVLMAATGVMLAEAVAFLRRPPWETTQRPDGVYLAVAIAGIGLLLGLIGVIRVAMDEATSRRPVNTPSKP